MTKHKWHKEIKAWADGASIQYRVRQSNGRSFGAWQDNQTPRFNTNPYYEYRIKPQEASFTKYANVYKDKLGMKLFTCKEDAIDAGKKIKGYIKTIPVSVTIEV